MGVTPPSDADADANSTGVAIATNTTHGDNVQDSGRKGGVPGGRWALGDGMGGRQQDEASERQIVARLTHSSVT